jgi:Tfp pilus assembly protein PilZ
MARLPQLRLEFDSPEALQESYDANLKKGRAFVPGEHSVAERELCELVLVHPESGAKLSVVADPVWVKPDQPGPGIGLQFENFDDEQRSRLEAFVGCATPPTDSPPTSPGQDRSTDEAAVSPGRGGVSAAPRPRNVHERVRALSFREREAMARQGTLSERVALERCYGASVWEALLQNPQLTPPEVIRIAKNGNLPRPLVGTIVSNAAWVAKPEVQRALLGNPRVGGTHLDRVLRAMSQADLARVAQQTNYRMPVRAAAKKLLRK